MKDLQIEETEKKYNKSVANNIKWNVRIICRKDRKVHKNIVNIFTKK